MPEFPEDALPKGLGLESRTRKLESARAHERSRRQHRENQASRLRDHGQDEDHRTERAARHAFRELRAEVAEESAMREAVLYQLGVLGPDQPGDDYAVTKDDLLQGISDFYGLEMDEADLVLRGLGLTGLEHLQTHHPDAGLGGLVDALKTQRSDSVREVGMAYLNSLDNRTSVQGELLAMQNERLALAHGGYPEVLDPEVRELMEDEMARGVPSETDLADPTGTSMRRDKIGRSESRNAVESASHYAEHNASRRDRY